MNLLTQQQVAEATRLSERTLERHRWAGTGPKFIRLGRRVFYRDDDVEAWIDERTFRSTSEADAGQKFAASPPRTPGATSTGNLPVGSDTSGRLRGRQPSHRKTAA